MLGLCTHIVKLVGQPVFLSLCKDRLDLDNGAFGRSFRGWFLTLVLAVLVSLVKYLASFYTITPCNSKCCGCVLLKILNPCSCTLFCSDITSG